MKKIELIDQFLNQNSITNYKIIKIENLGEVSEIFKIETNTINYILKLNSKNHYEIFQKEEWCLIEANKIGIPTPRVIKTEIIDETSFLFTEYIEGGNCSQIQDKDFRQNALKQLGVYARKLEEIKPKVTIADLKKVEEAKNWFYSDYINYEIKQTSDANDYLQLNTYERNFVLKRLNFLKNSNFEFVLCHGDLSLKNCIYNSINETFYLIDFGSAETQVKNYFEIMLKWIETYYDKNLSEEELGIFVNEITQENATVWVEENFQILECLVILYTLDKYRYSHDRNKSLESEYKSRFYTVLEIILKSE